MNLRIQSKLLCLMGFLFSASISLAMVDMKTANYSNSWTDIDIPSSGNQFKLKVERTYNSRSLIDGMFGFGWCSEFETKLDVTPEGNLRLTECGAGQEITYSPAEISKKEIEKTIAVLLPRIKDDLKLDDRALKAIADDLLTNHRLRSKYAADYKMKLDPKEGLQYFANGREVESFSFTKGVFTRSLANGTQMRFSREGRMTHLYDASGNFLKFDYEKDLVKEAIDNNGRKLSFKFYNNKKIKSISGPSGANAEYKFEGLDDLSSVKNQWTNTYNYEYDDRHNLIKVSYPDKTNIQVRYNKDKDWVVGFTDREKCSEDYNYELSKTEPRMHYWATVKKVCKGELTNESKHEFLHKKRTDGQIYLARVVSTINGSVTEIAYHEVFGRPLSIRRNTDTSTFEYFGNGQIKTKATKYGKLTYKYDDKNKKVAEVVSTLLGDKGKQAVGRRTQYSYDKKGNLTFAANSDGQKINMTYDDKGRIKSITDQAKKLVKIDYDEKIGKPSVVSRPGLGTIVVTYKSNGDIDKVNSNEGPNVAVQVASTFNNLLDILSPASPEVFN